MLMRKFKVGMAAVLILGIAVLFFVVNAFAQSASERLNCPSGALSIFDVQEGINVECVNALFATLTPTTGAPTDTPIPPTDTPIPPTETPTGPIDPFPGAEKCLDSNNDIHSDVTDNPYFAWGEKPDNQLWHDLWNEVDGCHYVHEHKDNPHDMDSVFGEQIWTWANGDISHKWPTGATGHENLLYPNGKHEGYGWFIGRDLGCENINPPYTTGCVTDFRVQIHGVMADIGAQTKIHSIWYELRVCNDDESTCGSYRAGGWISFGVLRIDFVDFDLGHPPSPIDHDGVRYHTSLADRENFATWEILSAWQSSLGDSKAISFQALPWHLLDPDDASGIFYCPDFECDRNGSLFNFRRIGFNLPFGLDPDGDRIVNMSGFTDRYGNIVEGCSEVGLNCVPFELDNIPLRPVSDPSFQLKDARFVWDKPSKNFVNYDLSPPGEFWIEYPN